MAGVIGPSNKLPGQRLPFIPNGMPCDECDQEAIHYVVGATDSFGSETMHLCNEHYAAVMKEVAEEREVEHLCDICKKMLSGCNPYRDPSEGMSGPVYIACPGCIQKTNAAFIGDEEEDIDGSDDVVDFDDPENEVDEEFDHDLPNRSEA